MSATLSCLLHKFPLYLHYRYEQGDNLWIRINSPKNGYEAWNYPKSPV